MPTRLTLEDHLVALRGSGEALSAAAATAGLDTKVPTCPAWTVNQLVAHQGMVHRWAAANLRGERDHNTADSRAAAAAAPDLLGWYSEGLEELLDTIKATADDATAPVFLNDAPPPRRFWARRQAHETTIHAADAVSATLGRWPTAAEVSVEAQLAVDGIDELVTGFLTRGEGKLHTDEPCTLVIRTEDTGHAWTVRLSGGPIVSEVGDTDTPDAVFAGSAAQLYLSLWNRSAEVSVTGRPDLLDLWRAQIRVRW
jgi:uncharacterized protein (TIGR03083 family)